MTAAEGQTKMVSACMQMFQQNAITIKTGYLSEADNMTLLNISW